MMPCPVLPGSLKGFPSRIEIDAARIADLHLNVLAQQVEFPIAVLKSSALRRNQLWMQSFLKRAKALIAPHGKTTMSPELIAMQIRDGAWAITAATSAHIHSYHAHGVRRILHANQLVGRENIRGVFTLLARNPELDFYTLVDSVDGLAILREGMDEALIGRPLQVLLEIGAHGGRTGLRDDGDALALARSITEDDRFLLCGIECFEGIYSGRKATDDDEAAALVDRMVALARALAAEGLFGLPTPIFSAGGSAYFALVARAANEQLEGAGFRLVLRSGCYLTHDSEHYRLIHERLKIGDEVDEPAGGLVAALEVWGCVQSRPEPGLALVNLGKRDISHDIDLPVPLWTCAKSENHARPAPPGMATKGLNDQHLFLVVPETASIGVGDLVGFGVSHPCTTFDKWKAMFLVDDAYQVEGMIHTCF